MTAPSKPSASAKPLAEQDPLGPGQAEAGFSVAIIAAMVGSIICIPAALVSAPLLPLVIVTGLAIGVLLLWRLSKR